MQKGWIDSVVKLFNDSLDRADITSLEGCGLIIIVAIITLLAHLFVLFITKGPKR